MGVFNELQISEGCLADVNFEEVWVCEFDRLGFTSEGTTDLIPRLEWEKCGKGKVHWNEICGKRYQEDDKVPL